MVQLVTVNLGNTASAEAAVIKVDNKLKNLGQSDEFVLASDIGSAGYYLSTAGEKYMQCGESDLEPNT